jgi:hypothetical protein
MTLSLTCACGVHLEVDETFAGQTINCPDCQRPLQIPGPNQGPRTTSGLAIASLVLALAGAFTLVGTILAVVIGGLALVAIKNQGDRLAGRGFALAGIVLGLVLTGLSLFAYLSVELFGLDGLLHETQWAGKLDFDGPLEVVRPSDGFAISRPSPEWGVFKNPRRDPSPFTPEPPHQILLLANLRESAFIACWPVPVPEGWTMEECRRKARDLFGTVDLASGDARRRLPLAVDVEVESPKALPDRGELEGVEMVMVKRSRGQRKRFLVRVLRKKQDELMYLVVGGGRSQSFARLEEEIRRGLDSFRPLNRDRPPDWQER